MNVSEPFIRRPVATTLLMAAVAFIGMVAFPLLPLRPCRRFMGAVARCMQAHRLGTINLHQAALANAHVAMKPALDA